MIIINYGTSSYYEKNIGDKYYCKDKKSAIKKINELLIKDWLATIVELSEELCKVLPLTSKEDLYIHTEEIDLI